MSRSACWAHAVSLQGELADEGHTAASQHLTSSIAVAYIACHRLAKLQAIAQPPQAAYSPGAECALMLEHLI